eukprot:scaffold63871_cov21-Tisochrysis_lutea.AAC.1
MSSGSMEMFCAEPAPIQCHCLCCCQVEDMVEETVAARDEDGGDMMTDNVQFLNCASVINFPKSAWTCGTRVTKVKDPVQFGPALHERFL